MLSPEFRFLFFLVLSTFPHSISDDSFSRAIFYGIFGAELNSLFTLNGFAKKEKKEEK